MEFHHEDTGKSRAIRLAHQEHKVSNGRITDSVVLEDPETDKYPSFGAYGDLSATPVHKTARLGESKRLDPKLVNFTAMIAVTIPVSKPKVKSKAKDNNTVKNDDKVKDAHKAVDNDKLGMDEPNVSLVIPYHIHTIGADKHVSYGELAISILTRAAEEQLQVDYKKVIEIVKKSKSEPDKHTKEQARRLRAVLRAEALRPARGVKWQPPPKFQQTDDVHARVLFTIDKNYGAEIALELVFNHKDDRLPKIQPSETVIVSLTHRNMRSDMVERNPWGDVVRVPDFIPSHHTIDVSDAREWATRLHQLFSHKPVGYFAKLSATLTENQRLILIFIPYQLIAADVSNLFTPKDKSPLHAQLQQAMRMANGFRLLVRARVGEIEALMQNTSMAFIERVTYNPVSNSFIDPVQQTMNPKNLKAGDDCPKFDKPAKTTFSSLLEWELVTGLASYTENEELKKSSRVYHASAKFVPVVGSFNKFAKTHLVYFGVVKMDKKANASLPSPQSDWQGKLSFESDDKFAGPEAHNFVFTDSSAFMNTSRMSMFVERRRINGTYIMDEFTNITDEDMTNSTIQSMSARLYDQPDIPVRLFFVHDDKEFKKDMKVLSFFQQVGIKSMAEDLELTSKMTEYRSVIQLRDLESPFISRKSLWSTIVPERLESVERYIMSKLLPYQRQVVEELTTDEGVLGSIAFIMGPGGSGKTRTGLLASAPFLLDVFETEPTAIRRHEARKAFLKDSPVAPLPVSTEYEVLQETASASPSEAIADDPVADARDDELTENVRVIMDLSKSIVKMNLAGEDNADLCLQLAALLDATDFTGAESIITASISDSHQDCLRKMERLPALVLQMRNEGNHTIARSFEALLAEAMVHDIFYNHAAELAVDKPVATDVASSSANLRVKTRGKILLVSPINSGVDNLVLEAKYVYDGVCDHLNIPRVPVVRLHSPNVENRALFEQLNPSFEDGPVLPQNIDINVLVEAELAALIQRRYLEARKGSDYRNIRDRRFKEAMCSESRYVLELAGVLDMSEEIRNLFTADELVKYKAILSDLTEASEAFDELGDRLTPEWRKRIARAAKLGLQIMMMHAPVIACTTSIMLEDSVIALVQPHIIVGDGMARDIESKTAGIFSCYPSTEFRVLVDDLLQIPPQMFVTDKRAVAFQQQRFTPMFLRFYNGGFPVKELVETYRYKNQAILDLVKTVYPRPIVAAEGAFDNDLTSQMCHLNDKLYKTPSPVVFLNVRDTHERVNSTGSKYCLDTAHVSIFDALKHAKHLPPDSVWILSPYRAQVHILKESLGYLSDVYQKRGDTKSSTHAANLAKSVATIDTFMGRDSTHIVLDLTTPSGHTFDLFARGRVGCTRQKVSFTIVGDATQINTSTRISSFSPVKRAMIHCLKHKIMYEISNHRIEAVFPMKPVFTALGYIM
jgi:hypothetical protein